MRELKQSINQSVESSTILLVEGGENIDIQADEQIGQNQTDANNPDAIVQSSLSANKLVREMSEEELYEYNLEERAKLEKILNKISN